MKTIFYILLTTFFIGSTTCTQAQGRAQRTSSARAAYGVQDPQFRSHRKKNDRSKAKARKAARRKKGNRKETYRRGMPI